MLIVSCVEFIPLQLPTTVSFKCVLISILTSVHANSFVCRVYTPSMKHVLQIFRTKKTIIKKQAEFEVAQKKKTNMYESTFCSFTYGTLFQVSGNTYQYETLSVYYTHKHVSVTKFVNSNKQPQTIKVLIEAARQKYEKTFCSFTYGTLNRGSPSVVRRLLLLCRHTLYGTFHHGSTFCSFHITLMTKQ